MTPPNDYVCDCTFIYDRTSLPPKLRIVQRIVDREHEVNGTGATILPFAVYEVDVALNTHLGTNLSSHRKVTSFIVAPPAGSPEPRQIGVRDHA